MQSVWIVCKEYRKYSSYYIWFSDSIWLIAKLKGLAMIYFWSGNPTNHFQKQGKIHMKQKKYTTLPKIAEITKKQQILAILGVF